MFFVYISKDILRSFSFMAERPMAEKSRKAFIREGMQTAATRMVDQDRIWSYTGESVSRGSFDNTTGKP